MTNRVERRLGDWTAEYLLHCRVAKNLSPHSLRAYAIDLADFELWFGTNRALNEVDRSAIRGFLAYLTGPKELAPASVKRRIACLKSFFKWAELEGGVEITPFHRLDLRLRLPKRLPRALEEFEVERLRDVAFRRLSGGADDFARECMQVPSRFDDLTSYVALELLYATAVRVSELCGLQVRNLEEMDYRGVRIAGKGNRERFVPIVDATLGGLLRDYVDCRRYFCGASSAAEEGLLMTSKGKCIGPSWVRAQLAEVSRKAGFGRAVTPHVIRHTAATHYLRAGLDLRHTQKLLTHNS